MHYLHDGAMPRVTHRVRQWRRCHLPFPGQRPPVLGRGAAVDLKAFTPTTGPAGTEVTITGKNLNVPLSVEITVWGVPFGTSTSKQPFTETTD